ncbi:MAG: PilX N-terminal domain-containing pilus assembly protein [candidate division Zixibacteria bacterium]
MTENKIRSNGQNGQRGMVLIVCLIILLMLSLIGIASITTSNSDLTVAGNELNQTGSFYAAESGLERAASEMKASYESSGIPPSPLPHGEVELNNHHFTYTVTDDGPAVVDTLDIGSYNGLLALIREFNINAVGYDPEFAIAVELEMGYMDALVPLYQFAVYYENDLEIAPGLDLNIGGRVHSNGNIYVQSDNNVYFDSYVTSGGDIVHGRKPGGGSVNNSGNVYLMDDLGNHVNMRNGDGTYLDSYDANWVNNSLARWGGMVEDDNHGITELNMPVVSDGPTTDLIDRGAGNSDSYENQAGLKFVDGQILYRQIDGSWLEVTGPLLAAGAVSLNVGFTDAREGMDVISTDIDIGALETSGYFPANGIIYASYPPGMGTISGVRLTGGLQLPSGGLTVATSNPLYTVGNYNTVAKQPASLIADAITVLSNNWDDGNSGQGLGTRVATPTEVNASYITGNTETGVDGHGYNGGYEGLTRFLENWSGVTYTWSGSASAMWYSRQATGAWGSSYYRAPTLNWTFDTDLLDPANLPPGAPRINLIQRTSWSHAIINEYHSPYSDYDQGNMHGN